VHVRRALLLFALVLGLTALATAIAPAPKREDAPVPTTPTPARPAAEDASFTFRAPTGNRRPPVRRVTPGSHVTLAVAAADAGQVEIPRLGLNASVTANAPARFDLIAPGPGRYDVLFTPTVGDAGRVGTLVTRRPPS
jgi:hypothetical protein